MCAGFVSAVYQACKRVGRQPSSCSGFWITRGESTRCPQNPADPAVSLGSSKKNFPAGLRVCQISASSWADRMFWGLCCCPVPRCLSWGMCTVGFGKGSQARSWNSELSPAILHLCPSLLLLLGPWFSLGLQVVVGPYCIPMEEQNGAELVPQSPRGMNLFGTCCRPKKGDQGAEDFRHSNK